MLCAYSASETKAQDKQRKGAHVRGYAHLLKGSQVFFVPLQRKRTRPDSIHLMRPQDKQRKGAHVRGYAHLDFVSETLDHVLLLRGMLDKASKTDRHAPTSYT